ncbi:uncharacterized protein J3D65DRAFT_617467 [Phyllosticta citribraziliensis]|uniref:EH domain-containing protein n=1 Tax=Phyllosticta citribraziliensis TaxID=989973 RepID=A0ABR1M2U7_9PEZI
MTAGPPHARMPSASANHPDAPVPHNTRNAALVGASTAFAKPPVKPKPAINTYSGNNGALAAARQTATATPQPLLPQGTGNSTSSRASHASFSLKAGTAGSLGVPSVPGDRSRSPSIVAATRAAAKHTPVPDSSTNKRKSWNNTSNESLPGSGHVGDLRSRFDGSFRIPSRSPPKHTRISRSPSPKTVIQPKQSTTSLVQPLQKRDVETSSSAKPPPRKPNPKPKPILTSQGPPPPVKSPKPQRNFTTPLAYPGLREPAHDEVPLFPRAASVGQSGSSPVRSKPPPRPAPKPAKFSGEYRRASAASSSQAPLKVASPASLREIPAEAISDSDEDAPYLSAPETREETKTKPILPPPRRSNLIKPAPRTQSVDFTKGTSTPADERASFLARSANHTPLSATNSRLQPTSSAYKRESAKMLEPHFTGDSLANAIVGASLATSRTSTPATAPPPPAPRRGGHQSKHHLKSRSRNPSPQKRPGHLLQTLRKEPSSSDDSDSGRDMKHKKKRHFRPKHPNKHKEGSRKRWRERVTERERKRYDGVWAANRGEFLPQEYQDCVHGFVVKDIWSRSRLPSHVLEVIWDLVDHHGIGVLSKEEFVVGLWVIDQALKGRKVPVNIQESVWESVRGLGVKVRKVRGGNRR